jgi:hypothetical protein
MDGSVWAAQPQLGYGSIGNYWTRDYTDTPKGRQYTQPPANTTWLVHTGALP